MLAAAATGAMLVLLLASDAIAGNTDPTVWTNVLLIMTAVEVLAYVSLGNRDRLERNLERRQAEQDYAAIRSIR
jgi:hypothetical protein